MSKPTIEELERIIDGNALPTIILPNGEIKLDYERCAHRSECHASKKEETAPSASSNTGSIQLPSFEACMAQAVSIAKADNSGPQTIAAIKQKRI